MPMFPDVPDTSPDRLPVGQTPIAPPDRDQFVGKFAYSGNDVFVSAFRLRSPTFKLLTSINDRTGDYDPHHNPLDLIKGTKYEAEHLSDFISSPNEQTTRNIMARIDQVDADSATLVAYGDGLSVVATVTAWMIDPIVLIGLCAMFAVVRRRRRQRIA